MTEQNQFPSSFGSLVTVIRAVATRLVIGLEETSTTSGRTHPQRYGKACPSRVTLR
jgi:hypothetical protein